MQVFILDDNFDTNASFYMNKHIVKIPLELTQVLSTVLNQKNIYNENLYKPTHINHPWVKWANNLDNFACLIKIGESLFKEYTFRYNKEHKSIKVLNICKTLISNDLYYKNHTEFPLCMPIQYHNKCVITAYRNYYINEKRHLAEWKSRQIPYWWK
jgi:hypothetical protein